MLIAHGYKTLEHLKRQPYKYCRFKSELRLRRTHWSVCSHCQTFWCMRLFFKYNHFNSCWFNL